MTDPSARDMNPTIGAMLRSARAFLAHEHSLFRTLGLQPVLIGRGQATFSLTLPEAFADEAGLIHGGLCTIVLDSIFGLTVFTAMEEVKPIATINLRTDYVARASAGARVRCAAICDAIRSGASGRARSAAMTSVSILCALRRRSAIAVRRSVRRAVRMRLAPRWPSASANPSPMPAEAPVTSAHLPLKLMSSSLRKFCDEACANETSRRARTPNRIVNAAALYDHARIG